MSIANSLSISHRILFLNALAFTACLACRTLERALVTFLVDNRIYKRDLVQIGWFLGIPILTGSVMRLPNGSFFGSNTLGYLLTPTGVWTNSWIFILLLSAVCLIWMRNYKRKTTYPLQRNRSKIIIPF